MRLLLRTLARPLLPALAALAVGCLSPEISPARLQTDSNEYLAVLQRADSPVRTLGSQVVAQFTNQGDTPLVLARCYPDSPGPIFTVELLETGDAWGAAYGPVWACVGHDEQFLVQPGETRTDTLRLAGLNAYDGITHQARGARAAECGCGIRCNAARATVRVCSTRGFHRTPLWSALAPSSAKAPARSSNPIRQTVWGTDMRYLTFLLVLPLGSCQQPSAPVPVPATIQEVSLRTPEEWSSWPGLPVSKGGASVTILGLGFFGCGTATASAERRGSRVQVAIRALNADRPCLANIPAWRPYRVQIPGLEPGMYDMTVTATGHAQRVSSAVFVTP